MAGTSADKLALLRATKADLKAALIEKGQTPGDVFSTYPGLVRAIQTGGASEYRNDRVTSIGDYAFHGCAALTAADFPQVTSIGKYAFQNCSNLKTVSLPEVTSISYSSFSNCSALETVNIPLATSIGQYVFQRCTALTEVYFPLVTSVGNNAFNNCSALETVNIPLATSIGNYGFGSCTALTRVAYPLVTTIGSGAFQKCTALREADFQVLTNIGSWAFSDCTSLLSLCIRNTEEVCAMAGKSALNNTADGLHIYVPSALIEDYKVKDSWSTYAAQFRALEDYTVDGTITGELDSTKI